MSGTVLVVREAGFSGDFGEMVFQVHGDPYRHSIQSNNSGVLPSAPAGLVLHGLLYLDLYLILLLCAAACAFASAALLSWHRSFKEDGTKTEISFLFNVNLFYVSVQTCWAHPQRSCSPSTVWVGGQAHWAPPSQMRPLTTVMELFNIFQSSC